MGEIFTSCYQSQEKLWKLDLDTVAKRVMTYAGGSRLVWVSEKEKPFPLGCQVEPGATHAVQWGKGKPHRGKEDTATVYLISFKLYPSKGIVT